MVRGGLPSPKLGRSTGIGREGALVAGISVEGEEWLWALYLTAVFFFNGGGFYGLVGK